MTRKTSEPGLAILKQLPPFTVMIFIIYLSGLVFNWRAVNSVAAGILFITGLMDYTRQKRSFRSSPFFLLSMACACFFILKCFTLINTSHTEATISHLRKSLPLLLAPFCFYAHAALLSASFRKIMQALTIMILAAFVYCIIHAFKQYYIEKDVSAFFYHRLASALDHHAIQLSVMIFLVLLWLYEGNTGFSGYKAVISMSLLVFLVLLSSKMVIVFVAAWVLILLIRKRTQTISASFIVSVMVLFTMAVTTPNPVSKRFHEVLSGNIQLYQNKNFDQGVYFNGLQFRLLQYRFTIELLNENDSWLFGLSPGDAQEKLDHKYRSAGMYTGADNRSGYLGYHTHNQFLQTLLQQGVMGLSFWVFICVQVMLLLFQKKTFSRMIGVLILTWCFTDAVLETQNGIALFLTLPLMAWIIANEKSIEITVPAFNANAGGNPLPA